MESRAQQSEEQLYVMNENLVEIESSFRHQLVCLYAQLVCLSAGSIHDTIEDRKIDQS